MIYLQRNKLKTLKKKSEENTEYKNLVLNDLHKKNEVSKIIYQIKNFSIFFIVLYFFYFYFSPSYQFSMEPYFVPSGLHKPCFLQLPYRHSPVVLLTYISSLLSPSSISNRRRSASINLFGNTKANILTLKKLNSKNNLICSNTQRQSKISIVHSQSDCSVQGGLKHQNNIVEDKIKNKKLSKWLEENSIQLELSVIISSIADALKNIYFSFLKNDKQSKEKFLSKSEDLIYESLRKVGVSSIISSRNTDKKTLNENSNFSVAFDLSYTQSNLGCIFGIWKGDDLLGRSGSDIIAAIAVSLNANETPLFCISLDRVKFTHIFSLNGTSKESKHENEINDWLGVKTAFKFGSKKAKSFLGVIENYSPLSNLKYDEYINFLQTTDKIKVSCNINNETSIGYSISKMLFEEGGVYVFFLPSLLEGAKTKMQNKMTLLHKAIPSAYLIEKAGGISTNGITSILNLKVLSYLDSTSGGMGISDEILRYAEMVGPPVFLLNPLESVDNGDGFKNASGPVLIMSNPRGFCEGVKRAVDTVEEALRIWGSPIYVKHEIVHNEIVCRNLRKKGAIFIENLEEVPEGSVLVYSAHGIPPETRKLAKQRNLYEVDATCPLVSKVHVYVKKAANDGFKIILIGHKDHVEIIGTKGEAPEATTVVETVQDVKNLSFDENEKLFYTTQTTLSLDDCESIVNALKKKYPLIKSIPSGSICYATTNRQMALKKLAPNVDVTFVIGSQLSSNAKRLVETSLHKGTKAYLINSPEDIKSEWLEGVSRIALTSSASTPETTVVKIVEKLRSMGVKIIQEFFGVEEKLPNWRLPKNVEMAAKR